MLIDSVIPVLQRSADVRRMIEQLDTGQNPTLAISPVVRSLVLSALFWRKKRPMLIVISGEQAAHKLALGMRLYLGKENVLRFPLEDAYPWSAKGISPQIAGARLRALSALSTGENKVIVASARALMRMYPPANRMVTSPLAFEVGSMPASLEYEQLPAWLEQLGYHREDAALEKGTFSVHGDAMDIYGADAICPVRIEFFGDEVDRIRKIVPSTGQTVCDLDRVDIYPACEVVVTQDDVERAKQKLQRAGILTYEVESELEQIATFGINGANMQYMPFLFNSTQSPASFMHPKALTVLLEPRSLFFDAQRYHEDLAHEAKQAKASIDGLYLTPKQMKFDQTQTLTVHGMIVGNNGDYSKLDASRDESVSVDEKFVAHVRSLIAGGFTVAIGVNDRRTREELKLALTDGFVPIRVMSPSDHALSQDAVNITDAPVSMSVLIPSARLALLGTVDSVSKLNEEQSSSKSKVTNFKFPFKPGDYVVHQKHGIAHFTKMEKHEVDGIWRDYLVLEYAEGDKLFIPVEQIGKVSKYVGGSGDAPKLTRLNTQDWSRAQKKASKAAKKLAFDLVDLYVRRSAVQGYAYSEDTDMQHQMEALFPYEETSDQAQAIADVKADMESSRPMDRLVCGDVGYGKTEVAIRAAFKAVQDGMQVMVLCPTTILAQQHFSTFSERFESFPVNVEVLSRFCTNPQQKRILEGFADGTVDVLIGTHRLLSRDVSPKRLGLVIIDEEQKFGVKHKEQMKNLREHIDVLTMTATPIPRTLQMSLGGVREMSLIDTPPSNRVPVEVFVGQWNEDIVSGAIRREMDRGGQVYYVATKVMNIDDAVARVAEIVPEARIEFAHGRMNKTALESVMEDFAAGQIDVLISTTIIESGLDNPHTNTLIIEDSHMLGLSQLYQLKGRVGRSRRQAYAYFMYPENTRLTEEATERLMAIYENQEFGSGIRIAMRDLEIRGAGSLMGAEQSGNISAIGFEAFTAMLADYVAEARGGAPVQALADTVIDLPAQVYLPDSYITSTEERVALYRGFATASCDSDVEKLAHQMVKEYGEAPSEALNMVSRAYLQVIMRELGIETISYVGGKVIAEPLLLSTQQRNVVQKLGGIYYPKSNKLSFRLATTDDILQMTLAFMTKIAQAAFDSNDSNAL